MWFGLAGVAVERCLRARRCVACAEEGGGGVGGGVGVCAAKGDPLLRAVVLGVQLLCMSITVLLAGVVFRQRKCKAIATGMWTILETILLGIFLLYSTVVVRFFEPSVLQCLIEPWVRELGFVICYGAIILKLYRILIEFRTRKAHRWVVRDKDLLKYLLAMVIIVLGYMAAWTASNLNFIQENYSVLAVGRTADGARFLVCKALWWDYVTETGELLILLFGLHLSFAARNAATQFQERRFLCLAIAVEAAVSGAFYALRVALHARLHPDYAYLAHFARSQLTSTAVLLLIFMPKVLLSSPASSFFPTLFRHSPP
ncbi:Probable G-protein coupled receptor CG31760 [Gryllus bimaculatus]|nr:Probable G-protein coupled receptor CG31760 [Gryllus bimaculatus]